MTLFHGGRGWGWKSALFQTNPRAVEVPATSPRTRRANRISDEHLSVSLILGQIYRLPDGLTGATYSDLILSPSRHW